MRNGCQQLRLSFKTAAVGHALHPAHIQRAQLLQQISCIEPAMGEIYTRAIDTKTPRIGIIKYVERGDVVAGLRGGNDIWPGAGGDDY